MLAIIIIIAIIINRHMVYKKWLKSQALADLTQILLSGAFIAQLPHFPTLDTICIPTT